MANLADEIVIDRRTGEVRQAGANSAGKWIAEFRSVAQQNLYVFAYGVLGLTRLTRTLHLPFANWLQTCPPRRKLGLLPRDHLKTSLVIRAMPLHMLIQDAATNIYQPGLDGTSTRILLAGEKAGHAENQLRWIKLQAESNERLRAFWPHRVWDSASKQSPKWSEQALSFPRTTDYPESSLETIGVGGAITGRHYNVLIKDDLVTFDAANSTVIMQQAIEWHKASRALMDSEASLEYIIGTKWANYDLYTEIMENDPSVEHLVRSVIEGGKPIFPELFTMEHIEQLRKELGGRFYLLYMNTATDPSLSEFDMEDLRFYTVSVAKKTLSFEEDSRDVAILAVDGDGPLPPIPAGTPLNRDTYNILASRNEFIRRGRSA